MIAPNFRTLKRIIMRSLRFALVALCLMAGSAFASPTDPKNGAEYLTLQAPQPVQATGNKVEVIEFFMYHCPFCFQLEPDLAAWVKKQGDNIQFRRVHFPFTGPLDPEAHLYLTLEAMGKQEALHDKVLHLIHVERFRVTNDASALELAAKVGLDKAKVLEYWNSFGVMTKMKRLGAIAAAYKVENAPTLVIDGKYVTSPSIVGGANPGIPSNMVLKSSIATLDALIAKVQKEKSSAKPGGK
jgi:thiol:disulfide interchange protein DsbA